MRIIRGVGNGTVRYKNDREGWNHGGCFEKLKIVVFLAKHVSFMYLCGQ